MNAKVDLPPARQVCPTSTRRLISEGALIVDVRERAEIDRLAFDVPDIVALDAPAGAVNVTLTVDDRQAKARALIVAVNSKAQLNPAQSFVTNV